MTFYQDINNKEVVTERKENHQYKELKANDTDAALEKHVPVYEVVGDIIKVNIGSIDHPMIDNHYIEWIALVKGDDITQVNLKPNDKPYAEFKYIKGSTAYCYCNLHGLWKTDIK